MKLSEKMKELVESSRRELQGRESKSHDPGRRRMLGRTLAMAGAAGVATQAGAQALEVPPLSLIHI